MFRREKYEELQELSEQYKNIAAGKILRRNSSDNLLKGNKRSFNDTAKTVFRLEVKKRLKPYEMQKGNKFLRSHTL